MPSHEREFAFALSSEFLLDKKLSTNVFSELDITFLRALRWIPKRYSQKFELFTPPFSWPDICMFFLKTFVWMCPHICMNLYLHLYWFLPRMVCTHISMIFYPHLYGFIPSFVWFATHICKVL